MSGDIHRDMTDLTGALAAAAEIRLKKIAAEEAALRTELAQLDDKRRAARGLPNDALTALRGIGGEMLWQGWLARARRDLQIRLARVLARKTMALRDYRQAHGRREAARALQMHEAACLRRERERKRSQRDQELMILREFSSQRK